MIQSPRFRLRAIVTLGAVLVLAPAWALASAGHGKKEKLPKYYNDWLNRDVVYIITRQERKDFLALTTDQQRDDFIKKFWEIRNPTPGSPANTYKDEIYERIAYADAHFSIGSGEEGWRTDRGRTYITLGKPQQIRTYYGAPNVRPMEIWFYSNLNPALPPFFYILFYQRDNIGDFRYYSPSLDGPDKLVSGMEAINDPHAALKIIQDAVGPEVARVAQTLIPGEPLDPEGRISLQSDVMLSVLKNLANQPSNVDEINRRRETIETVTSRMILDKNLDIVLLPVRDINGLTRLDYAIRLRDPSDLTLTQESDGRYSYAVEVRVRVLTRDKKLIFTQQKSVSGALSQERFNEIKRSPFGFEGILPLPPGEYSLEFLFTDWSKKVGFRSERDVKIPDSVASKFVIPAVLPFSSAEAVSRDEDGVVPFAIAGVRFRPLLSTPLIFNQLQELRVAYQVWAPPGSPQAEAGESLTAQYALGQPALTGTASVEKDTFDMSEFTSSGSVLSGKKFPLAGKADGNYILTVSINGSGAQRKAFASLPFQISSEVPFSVPWDVDEPDIVADETNGTMDQQRALCYLARGDQTDARRWFRVALNKNKGDDIARSRLVEAYYSLNAYSAVVSLLNDAGVTSSTDSGTIVQIAESLLKTGNPQKAVSLLQDVIRSRPDDGPLYLALADSYQKLGNPAEAQKMSQKGQSLLKTEIQPK
jgi:GWxTD domain-containing protein